MNSRLVSLCIACATLGYATVAAGATVAQKQSTGSRVLVEEIPYSGWGYAIRMSNGACEFIYVPLVNRALHFSLPGGENLFLKNDEWNGKTFPVDDGAYHDFGGDKIWPTQQSLWFKYTGRLYWPPPYAFDSAPVTVDRVPGGIRIRTPSSLHFGAHMIREFVLHETKPLISVKQRFVKTVGGPVEMSIWNVSQTNKPAYGIMELGESQKDGMRYVKLNIEKTERFSASGDTVALYYHAKHAQKLGVPANDSRTNGWAAAVFDNVMFVQSHVVKDGTYPDRNSHSEIFITGEGEKRYLELELLSPLTTMNVGDELRDDIVWQLVPIAGDAVATPEKAGGMAREAHRYALEILAGK